MSTCQASVNIKDHKAAWERNEPTRFINPNKNPISQVSKKILDKILKQARVILKPKQLISTQDAIQWFRGLEKVGKTLLKADIAKFYPSIKKEHVTRALNALRERGIEINKEDEEIIMASKVQIAQHNESGWVRVDSNFENSMGSSDGAEVCELV